MADERVGQNVENHNLATGFKNAGNEKFTNKNYKGAIADYKKGLLLEPTSPELHANLSAAYLHIEKYLQAEEHAIYTISLRPCFYKGYVRAAKAAYGKGMTTLALRHVKKGLTMVSDPIGLKELNRLQTQFTAYLSLPANAEREMDFSCDSYMSDDDESYSDGEERSHLSRAPVQQSVQDEPATCKNNEEESNTDEFKLLSAEEYLKATFPPENEVDEIIPDNPKPKRVQDQAQSKVNKSLAQKDKSDESAVPSKKPKLIKSQKSEEKCNRPSTSSEKPQTTTEKDVTSGSKESKEEKQKDRFLELCKELTKDPELSKHIKEFKDHLNEGSKAFLSGNYQKAAVSYKAAKERVGSRIADYDIDDRQLQVIKYLHSAALVNIGTYDDTVKAIQALMEMEVYEFSIPAIYIQLARAYCKLNRFKTASKPLEKLQSILDNCPIFPTFVLPGTSETIPETTPLGLKAAIKELNQICRMPHKPTAVCRYDNCLKTSTHIVPSKDIYTSDPDFGGFVRMICEEKCHIEFHMPCWKLYKETVSGISKINDKEFVGWPCPTTDCVNTNSTQSLCTLIEIVCADGQVKSIVKQDSKQTVDTKKAKKKKCKLDDKEKNVKQKKRQEKKQPSAKKPSAVVDEEDEDLDVESVDTPENKRGVPDIDTLLQNLHDVRENNYGETNSWNVSKSYYSIPSERQKWEDKCDNKSSHVKYLEYGSDVTVDIMDAKEFIFSYFMEILKIEGSLKVTDIEELWKQVADDFCNIKIVLPKLKGMCELLLESTCFCQLEDSICLAGQLEATHAALETELTETVTFLLADNARSVPTVDAPQSSSSIIDQLSISQMSSDEESEEEDDGDDDDDDDEEEEGVEDQYNSAAESEGSGEEFSVDDNNDEEIPGELTHVEDEDIDVVIPGELKTIYNKAPQEDVEPVDESKFSLKMMLAEMDRVKNTIINATSSQTEKTDNNDAQCIKEAPERHINSTFENNEIDAGSKVLVDDKSDSDFSIDEENPPIINSLELKKGVSVSCEPESVGNEENNLDEQYSADSASCDKGFQIEILAEDRCIQTESKETKSKQSQTKIFDEVKELSRKLEEEGKRLNALIIENEKLNKDIAEKDAANLILSTTLSDCRMLIQQNTEDCKRLRNQVKTSECKFLEKTAEVKKIEESFEQTMLEMKTQQVEIEQKSRKMDKENVKLTKKNRDLETRVESLERTAKSKALSAQQFQLQMTKAFWERQVSLLGKRCVEKISEMHSWFSSLPSGEVEELPSWKDVQKITVLWSEISNKLNSIQIDFMTKFNEAEAKLASGEEVDVSLLTLPTLPEEPKPLPLFQIHKEITEKHLRKISELTQLVANQQLEIEKNKDSSNNQNLQLMGGYPMQPIRMQTTAFGSLALQYPYPHGASFSNVSVPTIPSNDEAVKALPVSKSLQAADVQTLLKKSSDTTFGIPPPDKPTTPASFLNMPPPSLLTLAGVPPPTVTQPPPALPPPPVGLFPAPVGVAQNLLLSSSAVAVKKLEKKTEQSALLKPEPKPQKAGPSRDLTPVSTAPTTPTAEKTKKKKKNKPEVKEVEEAKAPSPGPSAGWVEDADTTPWCVAVNKKNLPKSTPQQATHSIDPKLKNKKKLLDKLQVKFPTTPLKDLDDTVKQVREQNDGSLSGLPFEEIEARVERLILRRHFQKSSTMGLVKFTDAAWGPVKQETVSWKNTQLEECTICLDPMGKDRTKVQCNHEFHTKCLRKWLKEKSVCPLCNKFTTMPDEFPAL